MRIVRLLSHMGEGTVPDEADRRWLHEFFSDVLLNSGSKARKHFGLPVVIGRRARVGKMLAIIAYVQLAERYEHGKSEALELAREAFNYASVREVEKIVAGTPMSHGPESKPESVVAWLEEFVTAHGVPLPTHRGATAPRRKPVRNS